MSAEYKNTSIDILKDICKERKDNFVCYDLILAWLEKHKVKTYGELEELLDSNDSEKLNGISKREKKQLRYEISQQKLKTSQPQKKVPLYAFQYSDSLHGGDIQCFDIEIARLADIEHSGGVIQFMNPFTPRSIKLLDSLGKYSIADIKTALGKSTQSGDRNGIYDLLRGERVKQESIDRDLVPRLDFYDDMVIERILTGELSRENPSLKAGLSDRKKAISDHFREIIEYLIEINEPDFPNIWGLHTDTHITKLRNWITNQHLTAVQLQDQQRFLEDIAMFLTNEQANSLFERCDIPILTKTGIQYVKQPPLDKFGGLARKKRAMVRSNTGKN